MTVILMSDIFSSETLKNIEFFQTNYPKYEVCTTVKSFIYRSIEKFRDVPAMSSVDPFSDLRGENKPENKSKNLCIVELYDDLLSGPKTTSPKVKSALVRHGFQISCSTIYHITKD